MNTSRLLKQVPPNKLAGEEGFEPSSAPSKNKVEIGKLLYSYLTNPLFYLQKMDKFLPSSINCLECQYNSGVSISLAKTVLADLCFILSTTLYKLATAIFGPTHGEARLLSWPVVAGATGKTSPGAARLLSQYIAEVAL